MQRKVTNTQKL